MARATIHNTNRESVLEILGWTEEQYYDFLLDMGIEYMRDILCLSMEQMSVVQSRMFWRWWVNYWNVRDNDIFMPSAYSVPHPRIMYQNIHQPQFVTGHPGAVIMEAEYDSAIIKMNKASQKINNNVREQKTR